VPEAIAKWWDGVELWLAQLPFPLQFALLMGVLLPLCLGAARLIDRVVDNVSSRFNPAPPLDTTAEPEKAGAGLPS